MYADYNCLRSMVRSTVCIYIGVGEEEDTRLCIMHWAFCGCGYAGGGGWVARTWLAHDKKSKSKKTKSACYYYWKETE